MRIRGLVAWAMLVCTLLLAACGGGSGRQGTDLVVTGTGPADAVAAGGTVVFRMTVANVGPTTADSVTIVNLIGNQLALTGITCTAGGGAVCPDAPTVSMTVGPIPVGGSLSFDVTTTLTANANGTVSNTLSANFDNDVNRGNNSATVTATAVNVVSNLVVSGSGPAGSVAGGANADFVMTVRNDGPDPAANLKFINNAGSFVVLRPGGVSCVASGGGSCPDVLGASMELATLPVGASLSFTISTAVGQGVNGTVTNTFQVTADTDNDRSDNTFTATATVVSPQGGVFATGVGPVGTVVGGGTAQFTMAVGNAGPDAATNVAITNNVGSNLTFTGISCVASGGATCPATLGPVMSLPSLPVGGNLSFTVSTFVAANTTGTLTNTLTVSADNDTNRTDNVATAVATAATPRAALVLTGTGPASTVTGGDVAVFTMGVTNSGPDAATGLRVVNNVGSNLTFVGATCTATAPAVCPAAVGVNTDVGTLPAGGALSFAVSARVAAGTNGAITNTLQAVADNIGSPTGNSVVAVGQAQTARSSLTITGTGPSNVPSGTSANFVMTLTNTGPDVAGAVKLVDTVGGNLTLTSVTCRSLSTGAVCPASLGASMDVANLPVGGQLEFTVAATVAPGTQGTILNTLAATVTTGTASQTSAVAVGSAYSNNLVVSAVAPPGPLAGSSNAQFTMTVTNTGPGPANNVDLQHTLSSGLTLNGSIGCSASGATCPATPAMTMTLPTIPANGTLSFTLPVAVTAGTNGTVSATLQASALGDARLQDNSDTAAVTAASPDLAVSQSGAAQVTAGSTVVFTAVVSNPTSAAASNLQLGSSVTATDPLVDLSRLSIVCTPSSGASCPATLGAAMTLPALPAGRSLTFTLTLPLPAAARGSVTSLFTLTASGDPNAANNSASVTTTVADARNGSYKVFAADGRRYDMTIDFDAGSYTLNGVARAFSVDASGGGYTVATGGRFRVATDLIAGSHDFGSGTPQPYIAARSFGSTVAETVGQYNLVQRDVPAAGTPATHAAVAYITGNTLLVCMADDGTVRAPGSNCPAGKQKNYVLTTSTAGGYVATQVGGSEVFEFVLARTDAAKFLLGALPASSASGTLRIALQDSATLIGGSLSGASSSGGWLSPVTLTSSSHAIVGTVASDTSAGSLFAAAGTGVGAMLTGVRSADAQRFWVMQAAPLAVAFGDFTAGGSTAGLLQVMLP